MAGKYKAEYEFYEAEDKHDGDCHRYTGKDGNNLSDKDLSSVELRQNPYQKDKFSATFAFSTPGDKRDQRIETVKGLLGVNAGAVDISTNSYGNASGFSVKVEDVSQKDLMRLVVALTHDAPKDPRGNAFHYAVMDSDVAGQIIEQELGRLKMTPVEAGLVSISTEMMSRESMFLRGLSTPANYVDVRFDGYPTSPVAAISENGRFCELNGATAIEVFSEIDVRGGQTARVEQAMQDAGIKSARRKDGEYLVVGAPADDVAAALQKAGLIAPAIADAVRDAAEAAHPGQQKINARIEVENPERMRHLPAAKMTP